MLLHIFSICAMLVVEALKQIAEPLLCSLITLLPLDFAVPRIMSLAYGKMAAVQFVRLLVDHVDT